MPPQLSFAAEAVAAAAWPVAAGVPGAAAADVLAPLARTDCAAAFRAPLSAVTLALALDQGAAASARRRLATARPTVLLHVNVTVLLVPLLPGDSTAAEIQVCSRMPFRCCALVLTMYAPTARAQAGMAASQAQAMAGVAALTAAPSIVFNATCATLQANVSLIAPPATQLLAPPDAPSPSSAWCAVLCVGVLIVGHALIKHAACICCVAGRGWR